MIWYLPTSYIVGMVVWLLCLALAVRFLLRRRQSLKSRASKPSVLRWVHAGLSLWMLLSALTGVELAFALCVDFSDAFNMTNISKRWFERHIDAERNDAGFRDAREFTHHVPEGVRRICFFGDSFTAGHGITNMADRFTDRIAVALERAHPGKYVVANLGEPGYEVSLVEALVHAVLLEGSDVHMVVYAYTINDIEGYSERIKENINSLQHSQPRFFLFSRTYFFNWLYFRFVQFSRPESREYFTLLEDAYRSSAWKGLERKLDQLNDRCKAHGVEFRMVLFPNVDDTLRPDYLFREAHRQLVRYCEEAGIRVLDLEPVFQEHRDENLTVNPFDAHPNERAHEIAADAIERLLLDDVFRGEASLDAVSK